jgi:hypothetical protein
MELATRRLTIFLPKKLYGLVEAAAREEFSKPSQYARRQLARAVQQRDKQRGSDEDD